MQKVELYINDQLADLSEDTSIELTYQINNLAEVSNQQGNTSKQFSLPLTQKNRQILGFPDDMRFTNEKPYTKYDAKVIQDGIEIIPAGIGEINGVDDDKADFVILSGNVDFFDALGGQVYEMGDSSSVWSGNGTNLVWKQYDHLWNVEKVAGSQTNTDGWIWPIVDYGQIPELDFSQPMDVRLMRPGFFLHTAIELLVAATGYTINPKSFLINEPLYKKLIVQFANDAFEHGSDYQNTLSTNGLSTTKGTNQVINNPRVPIQPDGFPFDNVITFDKTYYDVTANVELTATVLFDIYIRGRSTGTPMEVNVKFTVQNADGAMFDFAAATYQLIDGAHRLGGSGSGVYGEQTFINQKLSYDFSLTAGQKLFVRCHINNIGTGQKDTYVIFYNNATFKVEPSQKNVLYNQYIQCERILPDVSQKDFLKDTLQRFGITCQTDNFNKQITFSSFRDIVNNIPYAKNWTSKCVNQGKKTTFLLGNYSQVNWLRYQFDDSVPVYVLPKYFADDHIDINNKTINPTVQQADLFTSIFAPSANRPWYGGTIAQILKIDTNNSPTEFTISTKPRILIDQKIDLRTLGGKSVTFSDGASTVTVNDIVSVPYFYKPDGENLAWKDLPNVTGGNVAGLRSQYYTELEHILVETKKIVRYIMLTPRDILELDLLIPIYLEQDSAYYYINKIENWKKGQPTKVELVRL
jgi:hypothetical protein